MQATTYREAIADLPRVMDEVAESHHPLIITREGKAPMVLISLEDYNSMEETTYLLRNPKNARILRRSLKERVL